MSRIPASNRWTVGNYTFTEHTKHPFTDKIDGPLYKFWIGDDQGPEMYRSLDEAMAAAIAHKWMGPRADSAAGWYMRMLGADQ